MRALLAAVVAVGCNRDMPADECRREAHAMQALLRSVDTEGSLFNVPDTMQLVQRTDLPNAPLRFAPVIVLDERDTSYQGQPVANGEELRERLAAARARIVDDLELGRFRRDPPDPDLVYLQIDARVRWPRVVEAWGAAQAAGMRRTAFVFAAPLEVTPPPRAPIDDKLDAMLKTEDPNKATAFAGLIEKEVQRCPALIRSFGNVATTEESKAQMLIRELAPALIECKCRVNIPNLRSALWRLLANTHPTRAIVLDPAAPPTTIALPATATWADARVHLPPELKNATPVVKE